MLLPTTGYHTTDTYQPLMGYRVGKSALPATASGRGSELGRLFQLYINHPSLSIIWVQSDGYSRPLDS